MNMSIASSSARAALPARATGSASASSKVVPSGLVLGAARSSRVAIRGARMVTRAEATESWTAQDSDSYVALGRAHAFRKTEDGKLVDAFVIEAIPAGGAEAMSVGARTCYTHTIGMKLGDAHKQDISMFPEEFQDAEFSDNFEYRSDCAARTWMRQHAVESLMGLMPIGIVNSDYNFDLEDKRILNFVNVVKDTDNVKQDMSIDVYNRDEESPIEKSIEGLYNV